MRVCVYVSESSHSTGAMWKNKQVQGRVTGWLERCQVGREMRRDRRSRADKGCVAQTWADMDLTISSQWTSPDCPSLLGWARGSLEGPQSVIGLAP